jgi:glycine/D-amino acid oxidase-like deaminating enzyme
MPSVIATQRALRLGQPIWLRDVQRDTRTYPSLSGRHETTVAIVGGGITGALVAHAFASAGISTVVLEGGGVGRGSTAASSALLLQEPDLELAQLTELYGSRAGRRVWQLGHDSLRALVALLKRLRVRCDLTTRDAIYYARDREGAERLRRECNLRRRAGFGAEWLTPGELRHTTGIPARAAIRTRGSAQFDPYRACMGVLHSAVAAGTQVYERSKVRRIDTGRDRVRIRTDGGILDARRVVIATGYATPEFRPLAGRFRMYRTYVLATAPIGVKQRHDLGLSDVMVWDTERPYHYARWTPDRRLLLGGGDRLVRPGPGRRRQFLAASSELREYFEALLPALTTIETASAWEGLFAMTADSLPYVGPHRRYPAHWFALGYGGNGMTFGFLAARLLLEQWQGVKSGDHRLFAFDRLARARLRKI